jgi:hypothetical protein
LEGWWRRMICILKCVVLALKEVLAQRFDALEQLATLEIALCILAIGKGAMGPRRFWGHNCAIAQKNGHHQNGAGKELIVCDNSLVIVELAWCIRDTLPLLIALSRDIMHKK